MKEFDHLSKKYDSLWTAQKEYIEWMTNNTIDILSLEEKDQLVDLGSGTGYIANKIFHDKNLVHSPICVEPSKGMHDIAEKYKSLICLNETAEDYAAREHSKNPKKALLKEAVHHVKDRKKFFQQLNKNVKIKKILTITRPQEPTFPLFPSALKRFKKGQPSANKIKYELDNAGYTSTVHFLRYPISMPMNQWENLIRNRFISDLYDFSDAEIESGIKEIKKIHKDTQINFDDTLIFIESDAL